MPSSPCPREEEVGAFVDGRMTPEERAAVHRHAAECAACRTLLVAVVRSGALPEVVAEVGAEEGPAELATAPPHFSWTPPAEIDEFRVIRLLGRGGMGSVYLAHDTSLDRLVALKMVTASPAGPELLTRLVQEARAVARIKHPNVVSVFRAGEVDGRPYLVSEHVDGKTLAELPLPQPWRRVLEIAVGLARGLRAAHERGVLHRDIKPGNAILESDGTVKLLDFGLAVLLDAKSPQAPPEAGVAGTPRYMAPEVRRGAPATPRSDLFGLGALLHELCTGDVPRDRKPLRQGNLGPGVDPDFAALIARCLEEEPTRRHTSVAALCDALEQVARSTSTLPLPAGNPYRGLEPFDAEHRALFFGRDDDIRSVISRLRREPLVLIAGDSGVGKSSLCAGGVLPRIIEGALDERRRFTVTTIHPGRRPLEALAAALAVDVAALTADPGSIVRTLRDACEAERGLLLFVDQLEELITLCPAEEAIRFAGVIRELAEVPVPGVRVLLAVRGDFLTRVAGLPGMGDEIRRTLYLLRPLSPEGVREAIVGPARSRGVVFEDAALVDRLVAPAARGRGSLPLLEFTLAELWERRDRERGCITAAALASIGGVEGALTQHADGVLARLGPDERQAARRALLRLVTAEATRADIGEAELGTDDDARAALRALVEGRIVHARTSPDGTRYQVAHEALIYRWSTLQRWLDEDRGQRAILQRVEAASAEWERLERPRELLWRSRQLAEVDLVEPRELGPGARAFVAASRQAVGQRRLGRVAAVLLVPLAAVALYGGFRFQAHRETERFVHARIAEAAAARGQGESLAARAAACRDEALALFDGRTVGAGDEGNAWDRAEQGWADALELHGKADEAFRHADRALASALLRDGGHLGAREALAGLAYQRVLLAERFHRLGERADLLETLERADDDGRWRRLLAAPAVVHMDTSPPGARAVLQRYVDIQGVRHLEAISGDATWGLTPATVLLPAGSYLFRFKLPGRPDVLLPLLLGRGERRSIHVPLPMSVPEGYVYIPPGCFLFGSADPESVRRPLLNSPPIHTVCLEQGYLIGRTEVTWGEWIGYLEALRPRAPARTLVAAAMQNADASGTVTLRELSSGGWAFTFERGALRRPPVKEGELFQYSSRKRRATQDWLRFPLAAVPPAALEDYLRWLDRTRRLPGARLCTEMEWELAARGADGRSFPHGDRLEFDDANIDVTYGRTPQSFGFDEVGSHPRSTSPFGLLDAAGNVFELTRALPSEPGSLVQRGGSWYHDIGAAYVTTRSPVEPEMRNVTLGLRVCASWPAR